MDLISAVRSENLEEVKQKINGENVNYTDIIGLSLLYFSMIQNNPKIVKYLLELGADPNTNDYAEFYPLYEACVLGNKKYVKLLLRYGADPCVDHLYTGSALYYACERDHDEIVKLLLKKGANTKAKIHVNGYDINNKNCVIRYAGPKSLKIIMIYIQKPYFHYLKQYFCEDIARFISKFC